jgi:hypothetical protein
MIVAHQYRQDFDIIQVPAERDWLLGRLERERRLQAMVKSLRHERCARAQLESMLPRY